MEQYEGKVIEAFYIRRFLHMLVCATKEKQDKGALARAHRCVNAKSASCEQQVKDSLDEFGQMRDDGGGSVAT